ncbi:MAG TPA: hypothetical protein VFE58_18455 [Tepidisphaeraceae bacterium]|jgi:hypothetical protein|nr:hypothetical protein [Tepidisphaeraceae bacterium]
MLTLCIFPEPPLNRPRTLTYPSYIHEILSHAGIPYQTLSPADLPAQLPHTKLLLTLGDAALDPSLQSQLQTFLHTGGSWINLAGLFDLHDLLGLRPAPSYQGFGAGARTLGEGYLIPLPPSSLSSILHPLSSSSHPITSPLQKPLHFFNGLALESTTATPLASSLDVHGRPTNSPVLFEHPVGAGRVITFSIDLTGTIVHVQQGRSVTRDGVPAPDGTAPVSDGVLKSGDGAVLDWLFDRDEAPGTGTPAFLRPVADLWRDLLLRTIFHCASLAKINLPVLWYWPRSLPAVAHMSHDTDGSDPVKGHRLLELLAEADIHTTWCVILPAYDNDLLTSIRLAGHELATHYDSMTTGLDFCSAQWDRQITELIAAFGPDTPRPVTNKNHYLRWEGDMDVFDWCLKHGIQLDQSKGASKTGEAGYNFGTCHPYFPVRFNGDTVDVLELATPTQDLHVFAKEELFDSLLQVALRHHGVLHLLYHPAHTSRDDVGGSLVRSAAKAKSAGLEWWTGRQLNSWERARRTVQWQSDHSLRASANLPAATILHLNGTTGPTVTRWGFNFSVTTVDLVAGKSVQL